MSVNGINSSTSYEAAGTTTTATTAGAAATEQTTTTSTASGSTTQETAAATYEKSKDAGKVAYKQNKAMIQQMKADAESRTAQLRSLVEKMMTDQGKTIGKSNDIYAFLRSPDLTVDAATKTQAQKDIAADGYWGVEQTSDRLVSFAKALSGNDPSKADEMMKAIEKGFKEATKAWGDKLPDISQQTMDATRKKMEEWKNGLEQ